MNVFIAVPDDGVIGAQLSQSPTPTPELVFPGRMPFVSGLPEAGVSPRHIWLGPGFKADLVPDIDADLPFLNPIGDPDTCGVALGQAAEMLKEFPGALVFNHPVAVERCRRDRVLKLAADIQGVRAPKAVRITPMRYQDVVDAVETEKLSWPVIVRTAGEHGGRRMVRLEGPHDLESLACLPIDGRPMYVIEYIDFRDEDGVFRKWRLLFVGDDVFLRHVMMNPTNWNLHSKSRDTRADLILDETKRMARFESETLPKIEGAVRGVSAALQLDFFALDCHLSGDGLVTVFEANPCVRAFDRTHPEFDIWDDVIDRSWDATKTLARDPSKWRSASGALSLNLEKVVEIQSAVRND